MPTEKPRVTITVTAEELDQINEYRFAHKMKNQTQAILSLVEKGLLSLQEKGELDRPIQVKYPSKEEEILLELYRSLNDDGKATIMEQLEMASHYPKYKKCDSDKKLG